MAKEYHFRGDMAWLWTDNSTVESFVFRCCKFNDLAAASTATSITERLLRTRVSFMNSSPPSSRYSLTVDSDNGIMYILDTYEKNIVCRCAVNSIPEDEFWKYTSKKNTETIYWIKK